MSEWDQRQLCPDGGCVGVIGSDGTCKVCGRAAPNWGDERKRGLLPEDDVATESSPPPSSVTTADSPALYFDIDADKSAAGQAADPDWSQRKLCSDEACIGVIGSDGTCRVCGKRAA
jgi:hypothetical protein